MASLRMNPQRRSTLFDLMVTGIVALLSVVPFLGVRGVTPGSMLGLAMAAGLLVRRRFPLSVMAVVSGLGLAQVLLFPPSNDPMPYDVAVLIAMYSVVKYGRRRWHGFLAAAPVVIGIVIEVARHIDRTEAVADPFRMWSESVGFLVAICGAVWLTAYTVRIRRLYVVGLEERAATAERERDYLAKIGVVEERATIARDLHDVVAHSMAVMIVQADGASYAFDTSPDVARSAIKQVAATGRDALEDMRRLVDVLRGTGPDGVTPVRPDDPTDRRRIGLDQLQVLVDRARSAGLTLSVVEDGSRERVPAAVEVTVFRIVQEAVTNVLRHAPPTAEVTLSVRYGQRAVNVEVVDDGGGRLAAGSLTPSGGGHGLVGMRERVTVHGGTVEAGPRLGGGWRVAVEVPWT
jgi:signal transduction histidine kinase